MSTFLRLLNLWLHFSLLQTARSTEESAASSAENGATAKGGRRLSILLATGYFPGHLYPLTALGAELVKRGHNVTLCATVMEGSNILPDLPESYGINFVSAGPDNLTQADYDNMVRDVENVSIFGLKKFIRIAQWPMVKVRSKIDEIGAEKFDVIISDFSIMAVGVYYAVLGKKVVIFSPLLIHVDATLPEWPHPSVATGLSDELTFVSRMINMFAGLGISLFQNTVYKGVMDLDEEFARVLKDVNAVSYFGIRSPLIIATSFGLAYPKTRYPLTHYVGPLMMDSFPPLEHQLMEWLNKKTNKTVIYVGMGATGAITADMAKVIIDGILATDFSAVWALPMSDQTVLEGMDIDEERFYISKWIPRQTLFKHPTLVMTILHCAMNSVQESLYNGLPVVCVPHGFDHFDVATRVVSAKVGLPLYSFAESFKRGREFTADNITDIIKTITETKGYSEQAEKMREIFMFAGGAKRASDLVEFYAEVGYDHLIPAYVKYEWSWVQYYNLDVHCLLLLTTSILLYSTYKLLKCCYVKCCVRFRKQKVE